MHDMEEKIFERQESIEDDCKGCPYKRKCYNQCNEVTENRNPNLY